MRFITPINVFDIPKLFTTGRLNINVVLIQVSPPDDVGWMSFGISVDITLAASQFVDWVIAQINSNMPRTMGQSFIHVNDVDVFVEHDEPLLSVNIDIHKNLVTSIGQHVDSLIDDGSTLHLVLGDMSIAIALSNKNDLGFHSKYITDEAMYLYSMGVINNR